MTANGNAPALVVQRSGRGCLPGRAGPCEIAQLTEPRQSGKWLVCAVDTSREYLTVKDMAARHGIGVSTVWRQVKAGNLPSPIKIGGSTRWRRSKLEALEPE
ncbi:MAG: helix-turn-helix transcriptional regulator [Gemmobacter sp.]